MTETCESGQRGVSLVGTLLVLVILGGMATVAVTSLPGMNPLAGGSSDGLPGTSATPRAGSPAPSQPPSLTATAAATACQADEKLIEVAVATQFAATGTYPATISDLLVAHWLSQAPVDRGYQFSLEVLDGRPTGRVLVNGKAGAGACDA